MNKLLSYKKENIFQYIFILLAFLVSFYISIALGLVIFVFCIAVSKKIAKLAFYFVCFIFGCISFTQYTNTSIGNYDIISYYSVYYYYLSDFSFNEFIVIALSLGDIFFYFVSFIVAQIFPYDPRFLSLVLTTCTMGLLFSSIDNFCQYYQKDNIEGEISYNRLQVFVWILSFFIIISFPNLTNVLRQFLAMSLFIYGVSRKTVGKHYITFFVLALLTHWSLLIYILLFFGFNAMKKYDTLLLISTPFFVISFIIVINYLPLSQRIVKGYLSGNEILGVDKTLIAINFVIQLLMLFVTFRLRKNYKEIYIILLFSVVYSLLFITNTTITMRHYYFISMLGTVVLMCACISRSPILNLHKENRIILFSVFCLFSYYNIKTMVEGDFSYLIFEENLLFTSLHDVFSSKFDITIIR
ncbi:EpsG family protein [Epilithonimonas ginsengisoli]|uniref:EpsG family protein n=1 Tax=Epilithonimonas ginsengisoli TaxID=1245592 RepID=A0ABU4JGV4_9FLAO|nr:MULTISPECIES: EpsG family protein [Chryseobacterium group]MBV6880179.1 EpsG family protein [Epilithonimonas sp. FP105]MDW8548793.1 EpsG family protein [Epilithonimonas ginsengisoli]OAH76174.1 hypothetical protein AXA65_01410 [Chryseobacterium sp. FP211-J200]